MPVEMIQKYLIRITMQDNEIHEMHTGHVECIDDYADVWKNNLEEGKFLNINGKNGFLILNSKLVKSIEIKPI